jgi:hypothetical protein
MKADNENSVSMPPALLAEVQDAAKEEHRPADELVRDAVRRYLQNRPHPGDAAPPASSTGEPFWKSFTRQLHALPDAVFERLPEDGASEHDHYLYGAPKRNG